MSLVNIVVETEEGAAVGWREVMGQRRRTVAWPEPYQGAASIGVALESFESQCQIRLAGKPGEKDRFSLSYGEYGVRVGVWRILELLDDLQLRASFSTSGLLAQEWPEVVWAVADAGHEVVGHGWANDLFLRDASIEVEHDFIRRTLDAIEAATGSRPVGWSSPASSSTEHTLELLASEGILWCGDDASDDVPFVTSTSGGSIVVLPKTNLSSNDLVSWAWPANGPDVFEAGYLDSLATVTREGKEGVPQWLDIIIHCHIGGRPAFAPTIRRCLEAGRSSENLWWCTKGELASWALKEQLVR